MRRKIIYMLAFVLLMASASFPAFASENVSLQVNGDTVPTPGMYVVDGVSMIDVNTYARLAGADVERPSASAVTITENGTIMNLTIGKKEATLAGKDISLPAAPAKTGNIVFVPLRAVSNSFGFEVGWDAARNMVTLTRTETRNNMTANDLLVKSTVEGQKYNTYTMEGVFNIAMDITADGKAVEQAPQNMTTKLTGQIQNDPFQVYMKQAIDPGTGDNVPEMVVETYMDQEKMYIKAPGQDWLVQDMPFSPEFWKQQQDIQTDPLKAGEMMKELGILLNFGNDVTVNSQEYYVLNAALDMNKFMEGSQKIFQQAIQGMPQGTTASPADLQGQLQKLLENARLDFNYSVLINKKTLINDIVKFDGRMEMTMENPVPAPAGEQQEGNAPKEIKMDMKFKGDITITELGGSFNAPDVSSAKEMNLQELNTNK